MWCNKCVRYVIYPAQVRLSFQELSQEKERTLELLRERGPDGNKRGKDPQASIDSQYPQVQLQVNLRHIEEQMKNLLQEKEQAEERWENHFFFLTNDPFCIKPVLVKHFIRDLFSTKPFVLHTELFMCKAIVRPESWVNGVLRPQQWKCTLIPE